MEVNINNTLYKNKEWLENKYIIEKVNGMEIAKICDVYFSTIYKYLEKFNIPTRSANIAYCSNCGKELKRKPCRSKGRNYCDSKCQMEYEYKNGIRDGKEVSQKAHEVLRKKGHYKRNNDYLYERNPAKSIEVRKKLSGENNHSWKGGITPFYLQIRGCFEYRQWRSDVFTRDNFTCQICGDDRGGNLQAHHKISFSDILNKYEITTYDEAINCEALWNINNGVTLCEKCHIDIHRNLKLYKGGDKNAKEINSKTI